MAAARQPHGVKPNFHVVSHIPLKAARGPFRVYESWKRKGTCDVAPAFQTIFAFVRSEVNAASSRHDSPDPLTHH